MAVKDKMDTILAKEVTRKEFLQHLGFGMLAVIGFSGLIKTLLETNTTKVSHGRSFSYGGNTYGGKKN